MEQEEVDLIEMKSPTTEEVLHDFFMLYREGEAFKVFAQNKEFEGEEMMFIALDILARVMSESPNQVVSMTGDAVLEAIDTVERVVKMQQAEAAKEALEH